MDYIDNNFNLFNMLINYNPEARITFENLINESLQNENYSNDPEDSDINSTNTPSKPTLNDQIHTSNSKKSENNMQSSNDILLDNTFNCNLRENINYDDFKKRLNECPDPMNSTPDKFSKKRSISESETTFETSSFNLHEKFSLQAFERLLNSFDDDQDISSNNTRDLDTNNSEMIENDNTPVSTRIIQTGGALDTDTIHQTNQQGRGQNDVIIVQESSHFNKKFQVSQDTYSLKF